MLSCELSSRRVLFPIALTLAMAVTLLLVQLTYAESIQNFVNDPHWTRFNNPGNSNDFGFQNTNLAGGTAGEAGGFFSVTSVPAWYGDESVGNFGGNDPLSASGILNILSVDPPYNNNVFIGHFDNGGFSIANQNGIGFQLTESAAQVGTSEFRIFYLAGTSEGTLFTIDGLNLTRTWSYDYDPSAGSFGSLPVSVSGPGGGTATHFLSSGERGSIGSLQTFGFAVKPHTNPVNDAQAEIYVDNLSYTSVAIPAKVGGITQFLANGSNSSAGGIAILTGTAMAFVILAVGSWYARRRKLGKGAG